MEDDLKVNLLFARGQWTTLANFHATLGYLGKKKKTIKLIQKTWEESCLDVPQGIIIAKKEGGHLKYGRRLT